ncbi:DUF6160 family protein [Litoribrevibacter euphylliae]|uniref:DUF6160 family protein n=1 Tax=Litoribrevibacter euphylliae TaxID=1834034 RepID=A0ABV7HKA0_9GAMM
MKIIRRVLPVVIALSSFNVSAELTAIDDAELSDTVAQGGLYLSGEFSLNEEGGPINDATYTTCESVSDDQRCGARFSYKMGGNPENGWYVIDDWKGEVSFEGLTLRTRKIDGNRRDVTGQLVDNSGQPVDETNAVALGVNDGFGGDGASFNKEVLEIGLPTSMRFKDYQYTVGFSSHASPNDSVNFQQTNIYGVKINGQVNMSGNMLIFPTADK